METHISKVQAAVAEIYHRDGDVRPSVLVEEARPKHSPIHNAFEWNNTKAGHEYRLIQARTWIRKVKIIIDDRPPERLVHIPFIEGLDTSEGYYKPISVVARTPDEFGLALKSTVANLNAARAAYVTLKRAAVESKKERLPNFRRADRGFDLLQTALVDG